MPPSKVYRQVPNFNLIPLEYQKPTISLRRLSLRLLLALVIVAEVFFIRNLQQEKLTLQTAMESTRQKIQQIEVEKLARSDALAQKATELEAAIEATRQKIEEKRQQADDTEAARIAVLNAKEREVQELEIAIRALIARRGVVESDWRELAMKRADWYLVLATLFQSKPKGVALSSVRQSGTRVNVTGTASDYTALVEYYNLLVSSPVISQIVFLTSDRGDSTISFSLAVEIKRGMP